MNKILIVANLKSHLDESEAKLWLEEFIKHIDKINSYTDKQVIIAPSFTLLPLFKSALNEKNIDVAGQNISPFEEGAHTGEVNGKQIKDYADYVIIGHSERRTSFNETDSVLSDKVVLALKYGLKPIFCIQGKDTPIPKEVEIVAYEPLFAIGSGTPDTPENAGNVSEVLLNTNGNLTVLYGGSVTSENVASFTRSGKISGVLVGGASLDPLEFVRIIENA